MSFYPPPPPLIYFPCLSPLSFLCQTPSVFFNNLSTSPDFNLFFSVRWFPTETFQYWYKPAWTEVPEFNAIWLYVVPFSFFFMHSVSFDLRILHSLRYYKLYCLYRHCSCYNPWTKAFRNRSVRMYVRSDHVTPIFFKHFCPRPCLIKLGSFLDSSTGIWEYFIHGDRIFSSKGQGHISMLKPTFRNKFYI